MGRLDRVREVHISTGARGGSGGFAYSAKTILDELTMEPIVNADGERRAVEPLSGRERYTLPEPVGEVEGFHSIRSELATMPDTLPGVETVDFRVAFSPELIETAETLMELGLTSDAPIEYGGIDVSPREFLTTDLARQPQPPPSEEWKSFRVDVEGERDGEPAHYRYTTVVGSRLDDWRLTATAIWTGVSLAVAAVLVGQGATMATGAKPPETALEPDGVLDELEAFGIDIEETRVS